MAGAGARNFQMVEPELEIWVQVPQILFVEQVRNTAMFFLIVWTKLFCGRSQKI